MTFVPGLDLAEAFHREVLAPLIDEPHAAALLREGSEVLGFDTERSADHEWGRAGPAVGDPALRGLLPPVGEIDKLTHGDDTLVTFSAWPGRFAGAYRAELATAAAAAR